jgi:hypothetical protein
MDDLDKLLLSRNCKVIHQIWFNFSNKPSGSAVPEKFKPLVESWTSNNPDWFHIIWNDEMADWLVYNHYRIFWDTYSKFIKPIQRVDAFKFCIMHRYGGIYADMDTKCLRPVNTLTEKCENRNIMFGQSTVADFIGKMMASNYFIYAKSPGDDLWYNALTESIKYGNGYKFIPNVLNTFAATGLFQIQKQIDAKPSEYGLFSTSDIAAIKNNSGASCTSCYVIHEMDNTWISSADITHILMIPILILVAIIIIVFIIRKLSYKKYLSYAETYNN